MSDPADERDDDRRSEGAPVGPAGIHQLPGEIGREHRHFALREIDELRRLVDHHQRQRHDRVDAAEREAGSQLMQELAQPSSAPCARAGRVWTRSSSRGAGPTFRAIHRRGIALRSPGWLRFARNDDPRSAKLHPAPNSRDRRGAPSRRRGAPREGPLSATRPVSMRTAWSARSSASEAFCSTIRRLTPSSRLMRAERAKDFRHHERREAERGLVEHQQARAHEQRARDRQHLLLAARQRSRLLAAPLGEARKEAEHALEVRAHALPVGPHIGAEAQVLLDREVGERAAPVGHMRDAEPRDVLGRERRRSGGRESGCRPRGGSGRSAPAGSSSCRRHWRRAAR